VHFVAVATLPAASAGLLVASWLSVNGSDNFSQPSVGTFAFQVTELRNSPQKLTLGSKPSVSPVMWLVKKWTSVSSRICLLQTFLSALDCVTSFLTWVRAMNLHSEGYCVLDLMCMSWPGRVCIEGHPEMQSVSTYRVVCPDRCTGCGHWLCLVLSWYEIWQYSSRSRRGESATYLIAEYHLGRLQSTPLGKLCTDVSA
jgi:hypothetical protein